MAKLTDWGSGAVTEPNIAHANWKWFVDKRVEKSARVAASHVPGIECCSASGNRRAEAYTDDLEAGDVGIVLDVVRHQRQVSNQGNRG